MMLMIKGKSVVGVIPARSGSKGLPKKNIMDLCGKPVIAWSIEAGLASKYIDTLVVSTDSKEIADIAIACGAAVPFIRPSTLATDEALTIDVISHVLMFYKSQFKTVFDYIILLEPTSPIREKKDIDSMLEKLDNSQDHFDSIISLGKVHEHPHNMKRIQAQLAKNFFPDSPLVTRRQDSESAYFPYGVAYISKTQSLLEMRTFYQPRTTFYIINRHQCFEIDDIYDFISIEAILKSMSEEK
jgi:CMP-N,N'-diacetyllegionaminic acid synthase